MIVSIEICNRAVTPAPPSVIYTGLQTLPQEIWSWRSLCNISLRVNVRIRTYERMNVRISCCIFFLLFPSPFLSSFSSSLPFLLSCLSPFCLVLSCPALPCFTLPCCIGSVVNLFLPCYFLHPLLITIVNGQETEYVQVVELDTS